MTAARPTGITILAVLAAIGGVLGLFGGFVLLFASAPWSSADSGAILGLACARLRRTAHRLRLRRLDAPAVGLAARRRPGGGFGSSWSASWCIIGGRQHPRARLIGIVIDGAILYYLNQPGIKSLFGRA